MAVNQSKQKNPRFWENWIRSGAVPNKIVIRDVIKRVEDYSDTYQFSTINKSLGFSIDKRHEVVPREGDTIEAFLDVSHSDGAIGGSTCIGIHLNGKRIFYFPERIDYIFEVLPPELL